MWLSSSFLHRISLSTSWMKSTNEMPKTWQIWWSSMISRRRSQVSTLLMNAWLTFSSSASWVCVTPPFRACCASDQWLGDINVNVCSCPWSFYFDAQIYILFTNIQKVHNPIYVAEFHSQFEDGLRSKAWGSGRHIKLLPLQGARRADMNTQGECPGLGASAPSGREGNGRGREENGRGHEGNYRDAWGGMAFNLLKTSHVCIINIKLKWAS